MFSCCFVILDDDLITIIDGEDFAHAREYSQTGVVKMVIYSKNQVYVYVYTVEPLNKGHFGTNINYAALSFVKRLSSLQ